VKITINNVEFETPFWISGETAALAALALQLDHMNGTDLNGFSGIQINGLPEEIEAEQKRKARANEDALLVCADAIRAARGRETT
jgi:hypothetical protein